MYSENTHASCQRCTEGFRKTVLMPGDPLCSKFFAETYLKDAKLVNNGIWKLPMGSV